MKFRKISPVEARAKKPTLAELLQRKRSPITVILDGVRSRQNVGGIFRTSDAALAEKVFLAGITPKPPHREIDKSALGATEAVPWEYVDYATALVGNLKSQGVQIVALELIENSTPYYAAHYKFPACLIVGNEVTGVSQKLLDLCDEVIAIPMFGRAHSLNVVTAFGIALFEILKTYQTPHA